MRQFLLLKNQFQSAIAAQRDSMPDMRNRHRTMSAGMSAGVSFIVGEGSIFFPEDISSIFSDVECNRPGSVFGFGDMNVYAVIGEQFFDFVGPFDEA